MKKLKSICSAIAAFCVLALAGCDLDIPESDKPDYTDDVIYDKGTATVSDWGTALKVGFSPMFGTWTYSFTDADDNEKLAETTVTGADVWWNNRVDSTQVALDEGETLVLYLECTKSNAGNPGLAIHATNSNGWWWYNPGDGNFWGDDSLSATFTKTYTTDGTRNISTNVKFKFTITRSGTDLNWDFQELGDE